MVSNLLPLMPKHTVYVEPYAGGAALFFAKPLPKIRNEDHYREVLNDADKRIVNFYRVCQDADKRDKLLERLEVTLYSREEHRKAREDAHLTDVDQAWAWFVDIQMGFAKKSGSGWGTGVKSENHAKTWIHKIERLYECCLRLEGVYIESDDALSVIERWDAPQTLFFLDPPYPGSTQGYTHKFSTSDYRRLVDKLNACAGSFLLCGYPSDMCPSEWERYEFVAHSSASGQGQTGNWRDKSVKASQEEMGVRERIEVVWRVDRHMTARSEIVDLFRTGAFDCFGGPEYTDFGKRRIFNEAENYNDLPLFDPA